MGNTHSCGPFGVHLEPLLDFFTGMPEDNLGHVTKDIVKWFKGRVTPQFDWFCKLFPFYSYDYMFAWKCSSTLILWP